MVEEEAVRIAVYVAAVAQRLPITIARVGQELIGFERVVADVAAYLAAVRGESIDSAIAEGLRRLADTFALDGALMCQRSPTASMVPAYHWMRGESSAQPDAAPLFSLSWVTSRLDAGEIAWFDRGDDLPNASDRETVRRHGLASSAVFPLPADHSTRQPTGAVAFFSFTHEIRWAPLTLALLRSGVGIVAQALARKKDRDTLSSASDEVRRLRSRVPDSAAAGAQTGVVATTGAPTNPVQKRGD